jgi:hypothetical protein
VNHKSRDCPSDFPKGVNYKPLAQADVEHAKHNCTAKPASSSRPVTSVTAVVVSTEPPDTVHPVASVMGFSCNLVAYMPVNVLEGDSSIESSVSLNTVPIIVAISNGLKDHTDPLRVPHLFWHCSTSRSDPSAFPLNFDALIDNGSHAVLIREDVATQLSLHHHKLIKPEVMELTMEGDGKKVQVVLTEWVKLKLYDCSSSWCAKTVCKIIAPRLCSPILLGLPFLTHNCIVINHHTHTAIDKTTGFDLLNPVLLIPPPPLKLKLKEWFQVLQEDCKLLVTELNMVCAERCTMFEHKNEKVAPVDVIGTVRQ